MKKLNLIYGLLVAIVFSCSANSDKLADKNALPQTKQLFEKLNHLTGKGVLFGHQDDLAYGHQWQYVEGNSDVKSVCGDYPAIFGWDVSHLEISSSCNIDSVPFNNIRAYVQWVHKQGGINTFSWHADNPLTGGDAWDVKTSGVVASILPAGKNNKLYTQWLDKLADYFLSLKDEKGELIPIIFRPFHEHMGNWFWWGYKHCTTQEYIQLWRFTVEYLRDAKNVHNLLYAYSSTSSFTSGQEFLERYPGDEYIDMLGYDSYQFPGLTNADFIAQIRQKSSMVSNIAIEKQKLFAITEIGAEQIPDPKWWTEVLWPSLKDIPMSYVLVWRNASNKPTHYYVPFSGHPSAKDFVDFYNLPQTLFLKEMSR